MNFKDDWRLYDELKQKIDIQFKKTPELFQYDEYKDLRVGILKEMIWSYKYIRNNKINYSFSGKLKMRLKNSLLLARSFKQQQLHESVNRWRNKSESSIGVYLDDSSLYNLFERLIDSLKLYRNVFAFQFYANNDQLKEELENKAINYYSLQTDGNYLALSFFQRVKLTGSLLTNDSVFTNFLLAARSKVLNHIFMGERLFKITSPKALLLNAAEQSSQGYILSLIAHKNNCLTINSQNGWKGLDPINQDTNFDKWFVHDEFMKKVLIDSNVPADQLAVTGHPLEDAIRDYKYSGSLDEIIAHKKNVITLFSSFLHDAEQLSVASYLSEYCRSNVDSIVLVRLHPNDKKNKAFYEQCGFRIVEAATKGNKHLFSNSLFDILSVSTVSISFGSMISFQSKWFHVPAISAEFQEESILNYIDNSSVWHVKNFEQLNKLLPDLLAQRKSKKENNYSSVPVYERMKNEITALIN